MKRGNQKNLNKDDKDKKLKSKGSQITANEDDKIINEPNNATNVNYSTTTTDINNTQPDVNLDDSGVKETGSTQQSTNTKVINNNNKISNSINDVLADYFKNSSLQRSDNKQKLLQTVDTALLQNRFYLRSSPEISSINTSPKFTQIIPSILEVVTFNNDLYKSKSSKFGTDMITVDDSKELNFITESRHKYGTGLVKSYAQLKINGFDTKFDPGMLDKDLFKYQAVAKSNLSTTGYQLGFLAGQLMNVLRIVGFENVILEQPKKYNASEVIKATEFMRAVLGPGTKLFATSKDHLIWSLIDKETVWYSEIIKDIFQQYMVRFNETANPRINANAEKITTQIAIAIDQIAADILNINFQNLVDNQTTSEKYLADLRVGIQLNQYIRMVTHNYQEVIRGITPMLIDGDGYLLRNYLDVDYRLNQWYKSYNKFLGSNLFSVLDASSFIDLVMTDTSQGNEAILPVLNNILSNNVDMHRLIALNTWANNFEVRFECPATTDGLTQVYYVFSLLLIPVFIPKLFWENTGNWLGILFNRLRMIIPDEVTNYITTNGWAGQLQPNGAIIPDQLREITNIEISSLQNGTRPTFLRIPPINGTILRDIFDLLRRQELLPQQVVLERKRIAQWPYMMTDYRSGTSYTLSPVNTGASPVTDIAHLITLVVNIKNRLLLAYQNASTNQKPKLSVIDRLRNLDQIARATVASVFNHSGAILERWYMNELNYVEPYYNTEDPRLTSPLRRWTESVAGVEEAFGANLRREPVAIDVRDMLTIFYTAEGLVPRDVYLQLGTVDAAMRANMTGKPTRTDVQVIDVREQQMLNYKELQAGGRFRDAIAMLQLIMRFDEPDNPFYQYRDQFRDLMNVSSAAEILARIQLVFKINIYSVLSSLGVTDGLSDPRMKNATIVMLNEFKQANLRLQPRASRFGLLIMRLSQRLEALLLISRRLILDTTSFLYQRTNGLRISAEFTEQLNPYIIQESAFDFERPILLENINFRYEVVDARTYPSLNFNKDGIDTIIYKPSDVGLIWADNLKRVVFSIASMNLIPKTHTTLVNDSVAMGKMGILLPDVPIEYTIETIPTRDTVVSDPLEYMGILEKFGTILQGDVMRLTFYDTTLAEYSINNRLQKGYFATLYRPNEALIDRSLLSGVFDSVHQPDAFKEPDPDNWAYGSIRNGVNCYPTRPDIPKSTYIKPNFNNEVKVVCLYEEVLPETVISDPNTQFNDLELLV